MTGKNNWEYIRGHKPGGAKKKKPSTTRAARTEEVDMVTLSVDVSEAKLDQMWAKLDIGTKGAAMQVALQIAE
jgi:hypothetical protein